MRTNLEPSRVGEVVVNPAMAGTCRRKSVRCDEDGRNTHYRIERVAGPCRTEGITRISAGRVVAVIVVTLLLILAGACFKETLSTMSVGFGVLANGPAVWKALKKLCVRDKKELDGTP